MEQLRNIGPTSARRLAAVGITSATALEQLGSIVAYRRVRDRFPAETSLNLLYAIEGALLDVAWYELPPTVTERLRAAVEA